MILGVIKPLLRRLKGALRRDASEPIFTSSGDYWERRYRAGGTSGTGSYGEAATFKAGMINEFVAKHAVQSVLEYGCGDGNQLAAANYPSYVGVDISQTVVRSCRARFAGDPSKRFYEASDSEAEAETAELTLSLDVIYHLVEDAVYESYMRRLFDHATRYVIVFSSNTDDDPSTNPHVRHRKFTSWIETHRPKWVQIGFVRNETSRAKDPSGSHADFYVFRDSSRQAL